jgi:hypothetical protein
LAKPSGVGDAVRVIDHDLKRAVEIFAETGHIPRLIFSAAWFMMTVASKDTFAWSVALVLYEVLARLFSR